MSIRTARHPLASLVALFGILATLLLSCQPTTTTDLAKDQTLRMIWTNGGYPITAFDPANAYDTVHAQVASLLFDGLVTIDRNEQIEPWGAESWTISPDGLSYTFRLRPDLRFSDNTPLEPSDYAWSIDRVVNPCTATYLAYPLVAIKDVIAFNAEKCERGEPQGALTSLVGDALIADDSANTLTIRLAHPAGYFLAALTSPAFYAVERKVVTLPNLAHDDYWTNHMDDGKTGQGGGGMFYLAAQSREGGVILKQNPYWWGMRQGKRPHFTEIVINASASATPGFSEFVDNPSIAFADTVVDLQPNLPLATVREQPYYHERPWLAVQTLLLNWKIAPFDDLNARKAFCLAINRDQLNQQALAGNYLPTWHLMPQELPGYNTDLHGLDGAAPSGDLALATRYWKRYLAAHPKYSPPSSIEMLYLDSSARQQAIVGSLQISLGQIFGRPVTLTPAWVPHILGASPDWQYHLPMQLFFWRVDYPDPQDFLSTLYTSDSPYNTQNASVPAADKLMRQADALPDLAQRIPLYQQAEQLLIDNVAVCPLYQTVAQYALRPWVKGGFEEDGRGLFPNDAWVSGYIAKH